MRIWKPVSAILSALFAILIPVVLLLTDVQLVAFDRNYYQKEYIKYNITQQIGMEMNELMSSTDKLLKYLEDKRADLNFKADFRGRQEEFFSQGDKRHMVDVKQLFDKGRYIRNFALAYIAIFLILLYISRGRRDFKHSLAKHGLAIFFVGILPVIILVILMNLDFYKYFTIFHEIFFNNDLWMLDPATDRLINIFPQDFFTDMAFKISYFYIAEMVVLFLVSLAALKLYKSKTK